ncbi:MAG: class II aldolase/adducin family protein [Hespellia sp.]|nr:class II aldolase/adducin family protein [Hespellia sp.]
MNLNMLHPAEQLAIIIKRVYNQRRTTTSGGNISIKDENGDMWITPGAIDKGNLTKDDMICIKPDGTIIGRHKPSSEYPFHQRIYEVRPDLRAVLHAHPSALVAFSIVRKLPDTTLTPQIYYECGKPGMAKYAMTGSEELGEKIAEVFAQNLNVAILENHGVVVGAGCLQDAFGLFETMESAARMEINATTIGSKKSLDVELLESCRETQASELPEFVCESYSSAEKEARKTICDFAARAYRQELINSVQGSFSERTGEHSFVITPHHCDRLSLEPADIVSVENGAVEKGKVPSAMVLIHEAIYEQHPEIHNIIICQPMNVTAFAVTDTPLDSRTIPESYINMRDIPRLPKPIMMLDAKEVAAAFNESTPIVLAQNDSVIVTGDNMLQVFDRLEVAEYSAMSIIMSKNQGEMVPIDEKGLEDIRKGFHLK